MFHLFLPIAGIVIALALFFVYVQPTFQEVKLIEAETAQYREAVGHAAELERRINELKSRQSSIALSDLERLEAFLPDRVDDVALLMDLSALASEHGLTFGNLNEAQDGADLPAEDPEEFGAFDDEASAAKPYTPHDVTFAVSGSYAGFRSFLADLERSLMLAEVMSITFTESEGDALSFNMRVRFYSLKQPGT